MLEELREKNKTIYRIAGVMLHISPDKDLNAEILTDYIKGCAQAIQDLSGDLMQVLDDMEV